MALVALFCFTRARFVFPVDLQEQHLDVLLKRLDALIEISTQRAFINATNDICANIQEQCLVSRGVNEDNTKQLEEDLCKLQEKVHLCSVRAFCPWGQTRGAKGYRCFLHIAPLELGQGRKRQGRE